MTAPAVLPTFVLRSPAGTALLTIPSTGFELVDYKRPPRRRRRQVAQGPYNPGEVELSSVLDVSQLVITVLITGVTYADSQDLYVDLETAAEQGPGGLVDVGFNSSVEQWTATGSPDIEEEGGRDATALRWSFKRRVTITWPVDPYPT